MLFLLTRVVAPAVVIAWLWRRQSKTKLDWLRTGDVYIVLAHLKKGSVKVGTGETVTVGQPIGQIGNSGNTSEPHLHIHAVRRGGKVSPDRILNSGVPVPLLIEGRFLVRNNTF
ncbi:MAG TPA: M23 family metallopeptidase [Thermoanaerobaculia bacterium]|nr:M23 family metallopeptidase [Thermoanaerobaculia bacterium]